jgi:YbgC/YbaW family acyl-CoA thioester hydrolase
VRFREVDAYGHMNMGHYLSYFVDHRFEGMRLFLGMGLREIEALPVAFHTRHVEIEYIRPLLGDEQFVITSRLSELKSASCHVNFEMVNLSGQIVSSCRMRIGCIEKESGRPAKWPVGLMERFYE